MDDFSHYLLYLVSRNRFSLHAADQFANAVEQAFLGQLLFGRLLGLG